MNEQALIPAAVKFTVYGNSIPMARARVFVDKHTGKIRSANPKNCTDWKHSIAMQALEYRPGKLLDFPLRLTATFYLLRPKSKPKSEEYPATKPDFDNLVKAITDALEGVIYTNDSRIVEAHICKRYGDPPRVEICLEGLETIEGMFKSRLGREAG